MDATYKALAEIVGDGYSSKETEELFIYSRDMGTSEPRFPNYIVMPKTTGEVQAIVKLANRDKIPLVPMGAGMNLAGLALPVRGGIVVDLRRMDRIIEVNEKSRYAVLEAAVSQGKLKAYLERHHPDLGHSMPEAPVAATVVANALEHGLGNLSPLYGFHSGMLNGLEVVLATGEVCKIGSCSLSPLWFSSGAPLPDLTGLFAGWFGTTGIITKAAFKLYPKPKLRDIMVFVTKDPELIPDVVLKITGTWAPEHITFGKQSKELFRARMWITGNSDDEIELKKGLIREALQDYTQSGQGEFLSITPDEKSARLELPPKTGMRGLDTLGGSLEYLAGVVPIDKFPEACRGMDEIASKYNIDAYNAGGECIGRAHLVIFFWTYMFNRGDPQNVEGVRKALRASAELAIKLGGIPWKPGIYGQKLIMERMEPNTLKLMMEIKKMLDPNQIMNPGNWEVS